MKKQRRNSIQEKPKPSSIKGGGGMGPCPLEANSDPVTRKKDKLK